MKTKNILRSMVASMTMLLSACTSDMPEYVGTNVSMYQSSYQLNPKLESFDYTINFTLGLSSAQDEEISEFGVNIKLGDKTETVIFLEDVKVSELDEDGVTYSYTFKDLKYNESYQYEYSYIYRSDLGAGDLESEINSGYIYQDRFSTLIKVTAGTPYDVELTCATIPVQLNIFDDCVKRVGVEYWYTDEYKSTKRVEYIEEIKDKTSNIEIGSRRTDKTTSYRCYAEDESGWTIYSSTYELDFPPVDESIAVDLGLSVKWAPFNIGSKNQNNKGWYYYPSNFWGSYGSSFGHWGTICGRKDYDTALSWWGNNWQMPNNEQIKELCNKCTWEKVSNEIYNGYKVTGPNGKSIFIPVSGYYDDDRVESKQDAIIIGGDFKPDYDRDFTYRYSGRNAYGIKNGQEFASYSTKYYGYQIRPILQK